MSTTAISDLGTYLAVESDTEGKYTQLVGITSAPATGEAPGTIEVTTLDSKYKQYIADRPDTPKYEFDYNYTEESYAKVTSALSLTETKNYLIVYQDGSGEKFSGTGATWKDAVSRGDSVKGKISFAVSSHEHVKDTSTIFTAS